MVTDDPDTPGAGNWEINLGNIGERTGGGWRIAVLDADINYGWGDRVQLKLDTPWNAAQAGGEWANGLGTSLFGVKWRFFDDEESAVTISTYPQAGWNLDPAPAARGVADPGRSVFLPIECAVRLAAVDLDFELGRSLVQQGNDEWVGGMIVAHHFSDAVEGMLEARARFPGDGAQLLLNLGGRWELQKGLSVMGAAGREVGPADPGRVTTLYYVGIQVVR